MASRAGGVCARSTAAVRTPPRAIASNSASGDDNGHVSESRYWVPPDKYRRSGRNPMSEKEAVSGFLEKLESNGVTLPKAFFNDQAGAKVDVLRRGGQRQRRSA